MVIFSVPVDRHKETNQCFQLIMLKFDIFLWKYFYSISEKINTGLMGYFLKSEKY